MVKEYPHMIYEIIESVHLMYEDEPDLEVDCMLYLKDAVEMAGDSWIVEKWFDEHNRCPTCGEPLATHYYKEPHYEFDPVEYEDMATPYCPNCDIGGGM